MSIHEDIPFDKEDEPIHNGLFKTFFLPLVIVLVAGLCFGIGRLSAGQGNPGVKIENTLLSTSTTTIPTAVSTKVTPLHTDQVGSVYASSKGKKYYYSNCHSTVSAANKISFVSPAKAEAAGYTLATSCKP